MVLNRYFLPFIGDLLYLLPRFPSPPRSPLILWYMGYRYGSILVDLYRVDISKVFVFLIGRKKGVGVVFHVRVFGDTEH